MADNIPDPIAKELVDSNRKNVFFEKFIKFIIDFKIITFFIGWVTALNVSELITAIFDKIFLYINIDNILLKKTVQLIGALIMLYLFVEYIFYKKIYTSEISIKNNIEDAIENKEKKDIEKKIDTSKLKIQNINEIINDKKEESKKIEKKIDKIDNIEGYSSDSFYFY